MDGRGGLYIPFENTCLVVIDFQEKLLPAVNNKDNVLNAAVKAAKIANALNLPVVVTEQVPDKIGSTVKDIKDIIKSDEIITKTDFSCFGENSFSDRLNELEIDNVIICGIEAHVCVLQTALDASSIGYNVFILSDAVGSRKDIDLHAALERLKSYNCEIVTVEMMAFEFLKTASNKNFKTVSKIIK